MDPVDLLITDAELLVTMDADGKALPSDWYLRLAREAQKRLTPAASSQPLR